MDEEIGGLRRFRADPPARPRVRRRSKTDGRSAGRSWMSSSRGTRRASRTSASSPSATSRRSRRSRATSSSTRSPGTRTTSCPAAGRVRARRGDWAGDRARRPRARRGARLGRSGAAPRSTRDRGGRGGPARALRGRSGQGSQGHVARDGEGLAGPREFRANVEGDVDQIEQWTFHDGRIFASMGSPDDEADPLAGTGGCVGWSMRRC